MSADKAKELGLTPFLRVKAFAAGGLDPAYMDWDRSGRAQALASAAWAWATST